MMNKKIPTYMGRDSPNTTNIAVSAYLYSASTSLTRSGVMRP